MLHEVQGDVLGGGLESAIARGHAMGAEDAHGGRRSGCREDDVGSHRYRFSGTSGRRDVRSRGREGMPAY
ncbi:hypothetical protein GCM10025869_33130 [Homoserinibacter gongjuensis]|uniref:Uncharacterized protein n=1 Tax=Homoserinibacter gongjuensis TaxID=1162968 RepID=A0ABQ6K019_9MICO|nr:hypothetical protein GCM10025869_33130 [Homoserinibacter gongjuensis]